MLAPLPSDSLEAQCDCGEWLKGRACGIKLVINGEHNVGWTGNRSRFKWEAANVRAGLYWTSAPYHAHLAKTFTNTTTPILLYHHGNINMCSMYTWASLMLADWQAISFFLSLYSPSVFDWSGSWNSLTKTERGLVWKQWITSSPKKETDFFFFVQSRWLHHIPPLSAAGLLHLPAAPLQRHNSDTVKCGADGWGLVFTHKIFQSAVAFCCCFMVALGG